MHRRTFLGPQFQHSAASPRAQRRSASLYRAHQGTDFSGLTGPYLYQILGLEGEILNALLGRCWDAWAVYRSGNCVGPCEQAAGGMRNKGI
jgi:hypothetical protein